MQQLIDLTKNQIELTESGEILGLFVLKNKDELKSKIRFIHKKPNLNTRITLKFILLDEAQAEVDATIRIDKGGSKTDTYLKIETLLLSQKARAHIIPSMEILEDDVKGGHGATIGMLDENQIWYLMSRGFNKNQAEKIMIEAFIRSIADQAKDSEIKKQFLSELKKLSQ